ncbi:MAG TPA: TMEM175 family protein, partial [Chloroflexia bacterium]|nr:TMEM175 family protein [Chloroflexia bacterium]
MSEERAGPAADKETGRLEAFSDGVFAVAITLLAFDILKVPQAPAGQIFSAGDLARALSLSWPTYASFLISFATILIMWLNHHSILKLVQKTDSVFLFANGFLLLLVTVVPFPTALLGDYLIEPAAPTAAAVYAGLFVVISLAYILLWWAAAYRRPLLLPNIPPAAVRRRTL